MLCSNIYHNSSKYTTSSLKKEPATMLACSQLRSVLSFTLNLTHLQANSNIHTLECVREGALLAAKHNSHKILSFLRASTAYCVCAFVCLCSSRICAGQTEWETETASAAVNAVSIFSEATFRPPTTQPGHCCACFHSSELLCWGTLFLSRGCLLAKIRCSVKSVRWECEANNGWKWGHCEKLWNTLDYLFKWTHFKLKQQFSVCLSRW